MLALTTCQYFVNSKRDIFFKVVQYQYLAFYYFVLCMSEKKKKKKKNDCCSTGQNEMKYVLGQSLNNNLIENAKKSNIIFFDFRFCLIVSQLFKTALWQD